MKNIPEGFMADAKGRLVPINMIPQIDIMRDTLVNELVVKAKGLRDAMAEFKDGAFSDVQAFVDLSLEQHGVKWGGSKGNVSLVSFDGKFKVIRAIQDSISFDEGLQAAKVLIDECIEKWTEGSRSEVRALINDAFQVDKEGKISTGRILSLRRLNIEDEVWERAMEALSGSIRIQCSKSYIRLYERVGDSDQYQAISLDMSSV